MPLPKKLIAMLHQQSPTSDSSQVTPLSGIDAPSSTATAGSSQWPFAVVPIPGKGMGAIANRDIVMGERILAEAPLFILRPEEYTEEDAQAAVEGLPPEGQQAFFSLCQSEEVYGPERKPISIFHNNSLPLGTKAASVGAGVFPTVARLNHSCTPNVSHNWNDNIGLETVHAGRAIVKGEELLTSYIQPTQTRDRRQAYLSAHFGFGCACEACSLQGDALAASNSRRSRIAWLDHQLTQCAGEYEAAMGHIQEKMQLLEQEGLADPCLLMQAEYDAFQVCKLAGRHKEARKWLAKARDHCVLAEGEDSPTCLHYTMLLSLPVKAPLTQRHST